MIVGVLELTTIAGLASTAIHQVHFADLEEETKEYNRIVDMLLAREKRKNDLPELIEIIGINKLTFVLSDLRSVALIDYAKAEAESIDMKDSYPHLFK